MRGSIRERSELGIIGAGFIGPAHVEALRRLGSVEVWAWPKAMWDWRKKRPELLSIPQAYGNYKDLLKDNRIEAIHNCTPNFLHFKSTKT
jgi:predicted dehydrogenase